MRDYFSLPLPVTARAAGLASLAARTRRIALRGGMLRLLARLPRALGTAVDLTSVATAADDRLTAAPCAQEKTARLRLALPVVANAA